MRIKRKLRQLRDSFHELKWSFVDGLVCASHWRTSTDDVLVIRLDGIGDFVLGIDAAQSIAEHFKALGKRVVFAAKAEFAELARDLGIFDEVVSIDRNKFQADMFYRFRMAREIRRRAFRMAISITYPRDFACSDSIIRTCGAVDRIGFDGNLNQIPMARKNTSDKWYTRRIYPGPEIQTVLDRTADFVRGLLGGAYQGKVADLRSWGLGLTRAAVLSELAENEHFYVLFPGAGYVARQWPAEKFSALANSIYAQTGWRGVICGAPSDKKIAQLIVSRSSSALLDWTGRTNLSELASILARSQFLVANETGALHLAAAVGTQSVCVLGGGHFGQFVPYPVDAGNERALLRIAFHPMDCFGCDWRCKFPVGNNSPTPCVERVEVDQVLEQVKIMLNGCPGVKAARLPLLKATSP